jgi:MFS family permease
MGQLPDAPTRGRPAPWRQIVQEISTMNRSARPRLVTPAFLTVTFTTMAYFVADGMTIPITPLFVRGPLGGNEFSVGLAVGVFAVSAIVLRPWAGRFADRHGRRPLLVAGAALFAVGMIGHLLATTLPMLIGMRLVLGAGEALVFVAALAAISDLAPDERRGEAISFFSLSLYLGIAIGPLIAEALLGRDRFWAVWIGAALLAGLASAVALRVPETRVGADPSPTPPTARGGLWRYVHPAGILPGLVLLTSTVGMGGFFAFVPLYTRDLGLDGSRFVFLLFAGIVIAFRSLAPWIPDRLGPWRAASVALSFETAGLVLIALWAQPAGLFVGSAVFAFGVSFAFPALSAMAVAAVPRAERGAVLGTFSAALDLAFGVGPIALGAVATLFGFAGAFLAAGVIASAGLVLLIATRGTAHRPLVAGPAEA